MRAQCVDDASWRGSQSSVYSRSTRSYGPGDYSTSGEKIHGRATEKTCDDLRHVFETIRDPHIGFGSGLETDMSRTIRHRCDGFFDINGIPASVACPVACGTCVCASSHLGGQACDHFCGEDQDCVRSACIIAPNTAMLVSLTQCTFMQFGVDSATTTLSHRLIS